MIWAKKKVGVKTMNKMTFSENQKKALNLNKQNILVSAGAGSGKTAVLVERIIRLLTTQNIALENILVLTFTNAGAQEFKSRIKKALESKGSYAHLVHALDEADITTFDAFSLKIIKKYGYHLNLNPRVNNLDSKIETVLLRRSFDKLMRDYYENPTQEFIEFAKRFLVDEDTNLFKLVMSLHRKVDLEIKPEQFTTELLDTYYSEARFETYYEQLFTHVKKLYQELFTNIKKLEDGEHAALYDPLIEEVRDLKSFDDFLEKFPLLTKKPRIPNGSTKEYTEDIPLNDWIGKKFGKIRKLSSLGSKEVMKNAFLDDKKHASFIVNLYKEVIKDVKAFKEEKNAFTFSDIAHRALELVNIPEVRAELQNQYEYILIDEYQDTSDIQEAFINEISTNNVYMVGDIKQSIYAFRNANSDIFRAKYTSFSKGDGGELVVLNDNYRSRKEVLLAINEILSTIMSENLGGANYRKDHVIGYANRTYDGLSAPGQKYGLRVLNYEMPEEEEKETNKIPLLKSDVEADIIIRDIQDKIKQKYLVFTRLPNDEWGLRPIEYRDFTILASRSSHFKTLERRFAASGIPLFNFKAIKINDDKVTIAFDALLVIYQNYTESNAPFSPSFRYAVASFLRSYVCNYTDQQLFDLLGNKNNDFSHDQTLLKIKAIAENRVGKPNSVIIEELVTTFDLFGAAYKIANLAANTYKLKNKLSEINNLFNLDFAIKDIIEFYKESKDLGLEQEISQPQLDRNSVNLMTIHNSKGMEFPFVYYFDLEAPFSTQAVKDLSLTFDQTYGFMLPRNGNLVTLPLLLAKNRIISNERSERMRLLYVALTRAREEMTLISTEKNYDKHVDLSEVMNFKEMLLISPFYEKHSKKLTLVAPESLPLIDIPTYTANEEFSLKTLDYTYKKPLKREISGPSLPRVSETLLKRGTLLHKYIELYDFKHKKLDYINNVNDRNHIKALLTLPLFINATSENVYREYSYFDEETGQTFTIDMFILGNREITLIDFKLANIDHAHYNVQVLNYMKHITKVFNRPVRGYLLSILNLNYRELKDE